MKIRQINYKNAKRLVKSVTTDGFAGTLKKMVRYFKGPVQYDAWFARHKVTRAELKIQRKHHFAYEPKISILVPVYRTPVKLFREMAASVMTQSYGNWELCIADGSMDGGLEQELRRCHAKDARIRYCILKENRGIAGNTNAALEMAEGEFIGFLDHDDLLEPDALYEVVRALQDLKTDIVYTDEDKVSEDLSVYMDPNFKPDFSIDLLRSHNYITHFFVVRTCVLQKAGGLRSEFDGAQDYDLVLRCIEQTNHIRHVAKPLYHWRMCGGSTAEAPENKRYCYEAGRRALSQHLERMGLRAGVTCMEEPVWGFYHVCYEAEGNPLLSIIIANKDHVQDLDACICSIQEKSTYQNLEFIIVENNSEEASTFAYYEKLQKRYGNVRVVCYDGPFNYSKINNFGVSEASGNYLLMLNNDTEMITCTAIEEMLGICCREEVGVVGAKLLYRNRTVQHAGIVIGFGGYAGHVFHEIGADDYGFMMRARINCNYSAVTAACLMTKRSVFEEAGGFSEQFAVAANDVDFCLKVRGKGYLVVYNAYAQWYHYESKTRGYEDTPQKKARYEKEVAMFRQRWQEILKNGDPYYNKNFLVTVAPFTLV